MIDSIDVSRYLDDKNQWLWNEYKQVFNISIQFSNENCYANSLRNKNCIIFVPFEEPDSASFTHELLHLYLPNRKIYVGSALECYLKGKDSNSIFDKELYDHISNSLEHIKMLPLFLSMGYPIEKFLFDYKEVKVTVEEAELLRRKYRRGFFYSKYNLKAVRFFIGKFFAMKADINSEHNYDQQLEIMKCLDRDLFSALDSFWKGWIEYDIEKERTAFQDDYHLLVDKLIEDVICWSKNKLFA